MHPSSGQTAAQEEVKRLLSQLQLQPNERARRRAAGRAEWFSQVGKPLQSDELLAAWPFEVRPKVSRDSLPGAWSYKR
jgi:chromosome partitioning protein